MSYFPDVAWSTWVTNVRQGATAFRFMVTVNPLDPNEAGSGVVQVGDYLLDNEGYPFLIEAVNGFTLTVYDMNEMGDGTFSSRGPYNNRLGYVYRPKNGAFLLTQAQLRKLDRSATDVINPIEKGIIWGYRGLGVEGDYEGVQKEETNITKITVSKEFILKSEGVGWQGGKSYTLTLDGLRHNELPYLQGSGVNNKYIHLDQNQVDALWTKSGADIERNSSAYLTGIFFANEIKSYTNELPLVRRDGSNVRFSNSILSDIPNSRVGIFTDNPLDALHLTGHARISTLAEAGNNSLVYANEHGRLVKIPFANDPLRFFRSDGTWGFQATEAIDVFDAVIGMQQDASLAPALTIGARYIILNPNSLHSSFGSITGLGNNDIVRYDGSNWVVAFDSSASLVSVKVLVTLDTGGQHNNFWLYSVVSGVWVNQGQAAEHDSLWGINASWKHLSSSEYNFFTSLVNGGTIYTTSNLGSGVAGRIPFWAGDRAMAHSDVLIWDNGNNRLSVGGNVTTSGRIVQSSNGMFYYRNLTSIFLGVGTVTGTIKINLPPSKRWSSTMMKCRISGFNYSGNLRGTSWELEVGGYNFSGEGWYNVYARIQGVAPFTSVRLGDDGTRNVILLGVTSTAWEFASICVTDFMATFMNSSGYEDGWSIDLITNETGISSIASPSIDLTIGTDGSYRFSQTPSVSGIAVSLSNHTHDSAYTAIASNAWSCNEGLNRTWAVSANATLTISNVSNGMCGNCRIVVTGTWTVTIGAITNYTRRYANDTKFKFTSNAVELNAGEYNLSWVAGADWIQFNIADYVT